MLGITNNQLRVIYYAASPQEDTYRELADNIGDFKDEFSGAYKRDNNLGSFKAKFEPSTLRILETILSCSSEGEAIARAKKVFAEQRQAPTQSLKSLGIFRMGTPGDEGVGRRSMTRGVSGQDKPGRLTLSDDYLVNP